MSDPTLFDAHKAARSTDPETSHAAAAAAEGFAGTHMGRILTALAQPSAVRVGMTQSELATALGLHRHQVNKRLADLHRKGKISPWYLKPSGDAVALRVGTAGRDERVWRLGEDPHLEPPGLNKCPHCGHLL